jgi:hypothetical protein
MAIGSTVAHSTINSLNEPADRDPDRCNPDRAQPHERLISHHPGRAYGNLRRLLCPNGSEHI